MGSGNTKGKYNQALCRTAIPLRSLATGERGGGISIESMEKFSYDHMASVSHVRQIIS